MEPVLSLENVSFRYGGNWAVRDVSLDLAAGELVGLLGPNGSGKSTLLNLADGVLEPQQGAVLLRGKPVPGYSRPALAREVAMVAQESHFHFSFSALEVVLMGRFPHLGRFQFEGARDMEVAGRALGATGCLELAERSIHELSGGEKQRVLIARALAQEPVLVLLDEPTAFLDLRFKREIFALVSLLAHESGLGVLLVSHDLDLAGRYCDRLALLKGGRIYATGTPAEVITEKNIEAAYECPVYVDTNPKTGSPRVSLL